MKKKKRKGKKKKKKTLAVFLAIFNRHSVGKLLVAIHIQLSFQDSAEVSEMC